MKFIIKHEIKGRLRIHVVQGRMTCAQADTLCWFLEKQEYVTDAKVYERTADAVICYKGDREEIVAVLRSFSYEKADVPENVLAGSGRELNSTYREKLITKVILHYGGKLIVPYPVRKVWMTLKAVSGKAQDRSSCTGCHCDRGVRIPGRFQYCGIGDVPARRGRTSGGVDA